MCKINLAELFRQHVIYPLQQAEQLRHHAICHTIGGAATLLCYISNSTAVPAPSACDTSFQLAELLRQNVVFILYHW